MGDDTATPAPHHLKLDMYREALEHCTDAIGMSTPEGRHYYQNRAFGELFGEIGADPPSTAYCDPKVGKEVFQTIIGGGTWTGEVEMYATDRRVLTILLRAYAIKGPRGDVIGLVGIHTDITARRRAEEALRLSAATYREVFDAVNDTIWVHDVDTFEFIDVNSKVTEMFGYSTEEALRLSVDDISSGVAPYTRQAAGELLAKAAAGEPQLFEWHTRHRDGHLFWTEVSLRRGSIAGKRCILAVERDITRRKQVDEALARVHALESLGTVAGGIAHDFNNLLMGVFGNIELAKLELPADHPASASLSTAHRALDNARHLTTRLLTFAKGGDPLLETLSLEQQIRETVALHLTGSHVAARFDVAADLWPVRADKGQLAEVISNLTINAKEAMPTGGTLQIRAHNTADLDDAAAPGLRGDYVEVSFEDEGVGIAEEATKKIFDPYFSTKEPGGNSGLGLAIVHGIITRHRGHIRVRSTPGAGATFSLLLPADAAGAASTAPGQATTQLRLSKHVLLMDDEAMVRRATSKMLERLGCRVETAASGEEAVASWAKALERGRPFDIAILDLTVPGSMGGAEAVGQILALTPAAKVVVSSGYGSDPVLSSFARYGFCAKLAKPFVLQDLHELLAQVLHEE